MGMSTRTTRKPFLIHWLLLFSFLSMLGSAIGFNLYREHQRVEAREQERLLAQTKVVQLILDNQLSSLHQVLGDLSDGWFQNRFDKDLNEHLKTLDESMFGVRSLLVLDSLGNVRASSRNELLGKNFSQRDWFRAVQQAPHPDMLYISQPFTTTLGIYSLNVCRTIQGPQGNFAGVVSATLDPEFFSPRLSSILYAQNMSSSIVHSDGILFMTRPEREDMAGKNLAESGTFFSQHLASERQVSIYTGTSKITDELIMVALCTIQPKGLLQDKPLDVEEVVRIFSSDPPLSYRLLSYLNSSAFGLGSEVTSLKHAISLLGLQPLKYWAMAALISDSDRSDKGCELSWISLQRALFLKLLAENKLAGNWPPDTLFLLGLFSNIDSVLGLPMAEVLENLPFEARLKMPYYSETHFLLHGFQC